MRPKRPAVTTDWRIQRCRARIAAGRLDIAQHVESLGARARRAAPFFNGLRSLRRLSARYAGLALPLVAMVFRKNKTLRLGLRAFGLWRLARTAYSAAALARRG